METDELVRLDKWLWAARFYKTRSIAKQMIETGKVEYNGQGHREQRSIRNTYCSTQLARSTTRREMVVVYHDKCEHWRNK